VKGDVEDPFNLRLGVAHGVDAHALARGVCLDPPWLAKIEVAVELAEHENVNAADHRTLERRSVFKFRKEEDRPIVGEQRERLA